MSPTIPLPARSPETPGSAFPSPDATREEVDALLARLPCYRAGRSARDGARGAAGRERPERRLRGLRGRPIIPFNGPLCRRCGEAL